LPWKRKCRKEIATIFACGQGGYKRRSAKDAIDAIIELADPKTLSVGVAEYLAIVEESRALSAQMERRKPSQNGLDGFGDHSDRSDYEVEVEGVGRQQRVDAKRKELEALKVSFDMSYLTKLTKDEARISKRSRAFKNVEARLTQLRKLPRDVERTWLRARKSLFSRSAFGRKATQVLTEALTDLQVSLKYSKRLFAGCIDSDNRAMGWRPTSSPTAYLVEQLTVPALLEAISPQKDGTIMSIRRLRALRFSTARAIC